mmetsp:Transcript_79867/g.226088  ORF Transcript_79867/g.226088 Transcript_79867/m.226088 type:complete len:182 (-) Transcript_79867:144-689(-)
MFLQCCQCHDGAGEFIEQSRNLDHIVAHTLRPDDGSEKKARVVTLVQSFTEQAFRGRPCVYIDEGTGKRTATTYCMDGGYRILSILPGKGSPSAVTVCPLAGIRDVFSSDDGMACFPRRVVSALGSSDRELLLRVAYRDREGQPRTLCMLERSRVSRDEFLEALQILCIYAQTPPDRPGGR